LIEEQRKMPAQKDTESVLREAMESQVSRVRPDDGFVHATVGRSLQTLRRHQQRRTLAAATVGVAVVVAIALVAPRFTEDQGAVDPATRHTRNPTEASAPHVVAPLVWARSLPRGPDAEAAYMANSVLHVGPDQIRIGPYAYAGLYAPVAGGWLGGIAATKDPVTGAYEGPKTGIFSPDGSFQALNQQTANGEPGAFALSPDGTEMAFGDSVLEFPSLKFVASVPSNVLYTDVWSDFGIVYEDLSLDRWLWTVGQHPIRIGDRHYYYGFRSDGLGLRTGRTPGPCDAVVELNVGGSISTVMTSCGHQLGEPFSPSGNLALAVSGDVIAIPSGRVVATLPIPEANDYNTFWEDEDDIVLEIDTLLNRSPYPIQLVRCTISTETCERASDVINVKNPPLLLVPLE
jgi:hypothetical protein